MSWKNPPFNQRRGRYWHFPQPLSPAPESCQDSTRSLDVGKNLRRSRGERGWSLRALAEKSGLATNTLSQHFGRASDYMVITVEEGQIVSRELREKVGHNQFANQPHSPGQHQAGHGMGAGSHNKHRMMSEAIRDCEAVLCGGMGMGAYQSMQERGIKPVVTDLEDIDEAAPDFEATAYIQGEGVKNVKLSDFQGKWVVQCGRNTSSPGWWKEACPSPC